MHEGTFARGDKIAQRQFCTEGHFCTRVKKKLKDKLKKNQEEEKVTD